MQQQKFVQNVKVKQKTQKFSHFYWLNHYRFRLANICYFLDAPTVNLLFAYKWIGVGTQ